MESLRPELHAIAAKGLYRRRRIVEQPAALEAGASIDVDGVERLVFCGNDYLGLARHPKVIEAFQAAAGRYGVGSGASHLVTGHTAEHHALEEELAAFTGRRRALLFSTGYMANLAIASTLMSRDDVIFEDRFNHASLLDAGFLSRAQVVRYAHGNPDALAARLEAQEATSRPASQRALIMTDGVFSMDGHIAPLLELKTLADKHRAWLMVDDAHGLGVLGDHGRGSLEDAQLSSTDVPILMGTLGKSLGTSGAFVAGDEELIELLIQKARTYIYTTALPPAVAAATRAAVRLIDEESWRRTRLNENVRRFRAAMHERGLLVMESRTPIQPVVLGDPKLATAASEGLWGRGFWVAAIRPPTVPEGTARLRITLSAVHTDAQIDALVGALSDVLPQQDQP